MENEEFVECAICGAKVRMLNRCHLRIHNITLDEYSLRFPNTPTASISYSRQISDGVRTCNYNTQPKYRTLTIEEALTLADSKPAINWAWIAGFFQAEGCVSANYAKMYPEIIIAQSEPLILDRIADFVRTELSVHVYRYNNVVDTNLKENSVNCRLMICDYRDTIPFISRVLPQLQCYKRQQVLDWCAKLDISLPSQIETLTWGFIAGFWEGDGYLRYTNDRCKGAAVDIVFTQKDLPTLDAVRNFFGRGFVANHVGAAELRVRDNIRSGRALSYELLKYAQTTKCREELTRSLLGV